MRLCGMTNAFIISLGLIVGSAQAETFTPTEALLSLNGQWTGTLSYLDYQANKWFDLPQTRTMSVLGDKHTVLETAIYDDGPKTGLVYIFTLSAFEPDGKTVKSFSTRKGRPASSDTQTVRFGGANPTASAFVLVFESDAEDGGRPARIRVTLTFKDNLYTTLKEVDFTDDAKTEWLTRNRSVLKRVSF